jgi:hypothetical protein
VPVLSTFFGIVIRMFYEDHAPSHFHVEYAEFKAVVDIESGKILAGRLPKRCASLVEEWRGAHVDELHDAWQAAQNSKAPKRIKPLA